MLAKLGRPRLSRSRPAVIEVIVLYVPSQSDS